MLRATGGAMVGRIQKGEGMTPGMNTPIQPDKILEPDLVKRIGNMLPTDAMRTAYYKEIRHLRSLPENDKVLRMVHIMQFDVVLMMDIPGRVASEREKLEKLCADATQALQEILQSSKTYHRQLDERLVRLPDQIAQGIKPEVVAAAINESLRQQFVRSAIPETASALAVTAERIKKVAAEFGQAAGNLTNIEESLLRAADTARSKAEELSSAFHQGYRWLPYALAIPVLLIGVGLGMLLMGWIDRPEPPDQPVNQTVAPVVKPVPSAKTNHLKSKP